MSLEHAILGFLNYGPFSGYDLKKVFDSSVRHFWAADQSQIYRTLARLAENGWAETEVIEQEGRPDRKIYHITPEGQDELKNWLAGPMPAGDNRSPSLVQVFFSGQLSDEQALEKFHEADAWACAALAAYEQVPQILYERILAEFKDKPTLTEREQFFWLLTLECGLYSMRAMHEWAQSVIQRIENKDYTNRLEALDRPWIPPTRQK